MSFGKIFGLLKNTFSQFNEDKAPRLGASLAYYTVFSLAPLLVIAIGIAGLVFGAEAARGQIMNSVGGLIGDQGSQGIQAMVEGASRQRTADRQVVGLRPPAGEDDLSRCGSDRGRHLLASRLDGVPCLLPEMVNTGGIGVLLAQIRQHRIEGPRVHHGGRVVVKIDHAAANPNDARLDGRHGVRPLPFHGFRR